VATADGAFVLTAVLLAYAFVTGPRLSSRTRVALNQLGDQFVHIELVEPQCDRAEEDIRIRSEDLRAVLPPP
jgi:hypothetical protein